MFAELGLPVISDAEVAVATSGYDAREMPDRDRAADVEAADELLERGASGLDVARALDVRGFADVAEAVLGMQRQRVSADYLQTSAVIDPDGLVRSAVNDPNEYSGPGTGYRLEGERWALLQALPQVVAPAALVGDGVDAEPIVSEGGRAEAGDDATEVVVAVGPAFADAIRRTIADLDHREVLESVCEGVAEGGGVPRIVRVRRVADVAFIAHDGARLSGSGVAIGLQSKGTAVIHRADLQPLDNLELFGMSPLYTLESYRAMGRNAAGYALGKRVGPVPDAARQLRAREAHRPHDVAARTRDPGDRARRRRGRARARRRVRSLARFVYALGFPPWPQCCAGTPWMITWMCSIAAPLDSCSAFVSASIIFGTDSSVTRRSYSFTSITGIASPFVDWT